MKKRLNRERLNVGRTTYAERVKAILRAAKSDEVCDALADQVRARAHRDQCDEMQWIEIAQYALNLLNQRARVTFVSEAEIEQAPALIDQMRRDGYDVITVNEAHKAKLDQQYRAGDTDLRTVEGFLAEYSESFRYTFVERDDLREDEQAVFERAAEILALVGIVPAEGPPILISETMRVGLDTTAGVWDDDRRSIVIKRTELRTLATFAGTLLHLAAHATSGAPPVTREFEGVLTDYLGQTAETAVVRSVNPTL